MVQIIKWDGRKEEFQIEKLARTLVRMGAPQDIAIEITQTVKAQITENTTTKEVYDRAVEELENHQEIVEFRRDLKEGLARIGGGKPFEEYVRLILREHGYEVKGNQVIQGACVTHEIDGIAEKDDEKIYVEMKHHSVLQRFIPFDVTLAAKAKWDDIQAGYEQGLNDCAFTSVLIVTNTRLSGHAQQYANCMGISHFGWNEPTGNGLDQFIEAKKLYPVTILRSVTDEERDQLQAHGILTLKQLVAAGSEDLGLSKNRVTELIDETHRVFTCCQAES